MLGINSSREPIRGEAAKKIRQASVSMSKGESVQSDVTRKAIEKTRAQYHVVWK